jgi:hypothetical protein
MSDYFGKETPKLGFGLMRLPKIGENTDIEQVKKMVDLFMEAGFTYFDTAFVYGTSEQDTKKVLVDRYPRESYTLAFICFIHLWRLTTKTTINLKFGILQRQGRKKA